MMMYFVVRVNIDQQGHQSNSTQLYTDLIQAKKRFYTLLASDIDNDNFQYELIMIVDKFGMVLATQTFDNSVQASVEE